MQESHVLFVPIDENSQFFQVLTKIKINVGNLKQRRLLILCQ